MAIVAAAALSSCAPAQKEPEKEPAHIIPVVALVDEPTISFESADGGAVNASLFATFENKGPCALNIVDGVTFTLQDKKGNPLHVINGCAATQLKPGKTKTLKKKVTLTEIEFNALESVKASYICPTFGAINTGNATNMQTIAKTKHAFTTAETLRKKQARIDAWRSRYSTTDYSDTILIGDSIMDNARSALAAALPGVDIDADSGRTLEVGGLVRERKSPNHGVLDHIRNDDGTHQRYVIGTGNNDPGGVSEARAEEMVENLGPDKQIYFITEMVTANSAGTNTTNASIDAMVQKYPNVHKIDWYGLVKGHESEYLSDWCHPRSSRNPDYAALIKKGLDTIYDLNQTQ